MKRAAKQKRIAQHDNFALIKTGLPTKFPRDYEDKQTTAEHQ